MLECQIQLLKDNCRINGLRERISQKFLDVDRTFNSDKQKLNISARNKEKKVQGASNEKKENVVSAQPSMSKKFIDSDLKNQKQIAARSKKFSKNSVIVKK